jgi:multidrug resistance efflux pump
VIELIIGTYGVLCWLLFKKFRLIPITTYTICTAILGGLVLLMGIFIALSFCHPVSHDARFYAPVTQIVPQVRGTVVDVPVTANQPLKRGDVLFRIESRPYQLEVERLEASLVGMNAKVAQLDAKLAGAEATTRLARNNLLVSESENDRQARVALEQATEQVTQTQSRLKFAQTTLERDRKLVSTFAATQEEVDKSVKQVETLKSELSQAQAAERGAQEKIKSGGDRLQAAREELKQAEAQEREIRIELDTEIGGVNPGVRQAMADLDRKRWELEQTVVRAPSDGYATYVSLRPGQMATPFPMSAPMVFVPKEKPMLIATFPQNVIAGIEPGLEAELAFKAYPGRIFKAKVHHVAPIIPEGQVLASSQLRSATPESSSGQIPVVFEYGDDVAALDLPVGAQASVAVYTHNLHAISLVRKVILRIKSWENYVFFLGH